MKAKKKYLDYDLIKRTVSIYDALKEHYGIGDSVVVEILSLGRVYSGPCPICKTKLGKPFRIIVENKTSMWSCSAKCDAGGNVLDFVAKMEDTDTYGAAVLLTAWFNIDAEKNVENKEPLTKMNGPTAGKGYLRELEKALRGLLAEGNDDATVRFVKAKVLESYRNGQRVEDKSP